MKGDLQAYDIQTTLGKNFTPDAVTGKGNFNGKQLWQDWMAPGRQAMKDQLYGQDGELRHNADDLIHAISQTQQPINSGGMSRFLVRAAVGGIMVPVSMISGHATLGGLYGGGVGGVLLGGAAISKALTNPTVARALISAAKGEATPEMNLISRGLVGVLQGSGAQLSLVQKGGSHIPGTIEDGKFQPLDQTDSH
jgi:hypothetical protein